MTTDFTSVDGFVQSNESFVVSAVVRQDDVSRLFTPEQVRRIVPEHLVELALDWYEITDGITQYQIWK